MKFVICLTLDFAQRTVSLREECDHTTAHLVVEQMWKSAIREVQKELRHAKQTSTPEKVNP